MRAIHLLVLLCLSFTSRGAAWVHLYGEAGNQRVNAVVRALDGGFTFTGATTPPDKERGDLWLVAVDSLGGLRWQRQVGERKWGEEGQALVQLPDSSYVVAGVRQPMKQRKGKSRLTGLVQAWSAQGEARWSMAVDSVTIRAALLHGQRVFLAGGLQDGAGAWLGQLDLDGRLLWTRRYWPGDSTQIFALTALDEEHLVLAGTREAAGAWCAVVDTRGRIQHEYCGGRPYDFLRGVAVHKGEITAVGATSDRHFGGRRVCNDLILRLDSQCRPLDSLQVKRREFELLSAVLVRDSVMVCTGLTADDPAILGATIGIQLAAWNDQLQTLGQGRYDGIHYGMGKALLALPNGQILVAGLAHRDARDQDAQAILFTTTVDDIQRLP